MSTLNVSSQSGGLLGLVFIVLLVLKLTGLATLTWFQVFIPIMIAVGLLAVVLGIVLVIFLLYLLFHK